MNSSNKGGAGSIYRRHQMMNGRNVPMRGRGRGPHQFTGDLRARVGRGCNMPPSSMIGGGSHGHYQHVPGPDRSGADPRGNVGGIARNGRAGAGQFPEGRGFSSHCIPPPPPPPPPHLHRPPHQACPPMNMMQRRAAQPLHSPHPQRMHGSGDRGCDHFPALMHQPVHHSVHSTLPNGQHMRHSLSNQQPPPPPPPMHPHPPAILPTGIVPGPQHMGDPRQLSAPRYSTPLNIDSRSVQQTSPEIRHEQRRQSNGPKYTQMETDQAWTVYAPPGGEQAYYYNTLTQVSTFAKPAAMHGLGATSAATPIWREYFDANSGKCFYSDGATTTWEKPKSYVPSVPAAPSEAKEDVEPAKKKNKVCQPDTQFKNKAESIEAFKGLLLAKEISPNMKWNDIVKLCSKDARWEACGQFLTTGERRQTLAEFQAKRANDLRTEERQEKARTKESFLQLLTETLPSLPTFSVSVSSTSCQLKDFRDSLAKDDRFRAVATETLRESLFLDFCLEFKKREERQKRNKVKQAHGELVAFFKEKREEGLLSLSSTWSSFQANLSVETKSDPRFVGGALLTEADRQQVFGDYMIDLKAAEADKNDRILAETHRAQKAQRDAYEEILSELAVQNKICPSSSWCSVEAIIVSHPSCIAVNELKNGAARDIFEDYIDEWNECYRRDRSLLRQLVFSKVQQVVVTPDTGYEEFKNSLLEAAAHSPDVLDETKRIINFEEPLSSARLYLNEILQNKGQNIDDYGAIRRFSASRRAGDVSSSEDEGEIVEE